MKKFLKQLSTILIAGIYTISPIDAVPDVIPIAGQSDDIIVIVAAILYLIYISKNKLK